MRGNNKENITASLIKKIKQEIYAQIGSLIEAADEAKEDAYLYNRAAGSILHDFYTGIEKIFSGIANKIDGILPQGEDWHIKLLKNMAGSSRKRATVISSDSMEKLKEYLGFRHLFRNIYGSQLNWGKLKALLSGLQEGLWPSLKEEFNLFIKSL